MITKELLDYMRSESAKGVSPDVMRQRLETQGWTDTDIAEAALALGSTPKQAAPTIPPAPASPVTQSPSMAMPVQQPIQQATPSQWMNPALGDIARPATSPQQSIVQPRKKSHAGLIIVIILFFLAGGVAAYAYFAGYFVSLDTVASDAVTAAREAKSGAFDTTISFDGSALSGGASGVLGAPFDLSKISLTAKGAFDVSTPDSPKLTGTITTRLGAMEGAAELRLTDKTLYGKLTELPTISTLSGATAFLNTWYSFNYASSALPTDVLPVPPLATGGASFMKNLTPDQKAHLDDLTKSAHFMTVTKRMLPEKMNGMLAYHFTFSIDKAGISKYAAAVTDYLHTIGANDSYLSSIDLSGVTSGLDLVKDFNGEAWIGVKDHLPYKITANFTAYESAADTTHYGKVTFVSLFTDWNVPVTVDVPTDSTPLDILFAAARARANDAKIQAVLSMLRPQAELYKGAHKNSLKGFCGDSSTTSAISGIVGNTCRDGNSYYVDYAPLSDNTFTCSDAQGSSVRVSTPATTGTICKNIILPNN